MSILSDMSSQARRYRHELIKLSVLGQGMTFRRLARQLRCSPSLVTMVSKGERANTKVQERLARVCGRPVAELFPRDEQETVV